MQLVLPVVQLVHALVVARVPVVLVHLVLVLASFRAATVRKFFGSVRFSIISPRFDFFRFDSVWM